MEMKPRTNDQAPSPHAAGSSALDTLLAAAVLAPSGDNTQPWTFVVDRKQSVVSIDVDPARDPSPMNAGQRMASIAIGAALENMVQTAEHNGWRYLLSGSAVDGPISLALQNVVGDGAIAPRLAERVTNRRVYDGGEVAPEVVKQLDAATGTLDGVSCRWITDRSALDRLAEMISRADALMLGTKPVRDAFLAKVRFDQPPGAVVDEGLALGSLEVSAMDQRFLKLMPYVPDALLRAMGGRRLFASVAKKLAASASGICLIGADDDSFASRVAVGRLWQRAWLALTDQGLAAQPMMSLCVLRNIQKHGTAELLEKIGRNQVEVLLQELERFCDQWQCSTADALMRFGFSAAPTTRAGRLAPEHSM
jgi:hypothetical protein